MTDLERVGLAARRNAYAIKDSLWLEERERTFMANAFFAFADEIAMLAKESRREALGAAQLRPLASMGGCRRI